VILLNHEDGTLQPTLELRRELTALIRRFRPDIVACTDPTRYFNRNVYVNHPDHRAAGEAALYAVFPSACTRFIFRELLDKGLEPHKVSEIYLGGTLEPDTFVDISDTIELKIKALQCHRSQLPSESVEERIRGWAGELGRKYGVAFAEEYRRIILR
jgi:LmbE family N-acetylglucosaminyl deacetylase